jgi:[acyl-carrier-protein] S-malonyltransferase
MPPRDLSGMGRHPPVPRHEPLAFFGAARQDGGGAGPSVLVGVAARDPYFPTQDNGAGSALHVAVTHGRLDMVHFLLSSSCAYDDKEGAKAEAAAAGASPSSSSTPAPLCPAVNQRDFARGFTPLHRAAALAHMTGYLEIYEYLLVRSWATSRARALARGLDDAPASRKPADAASRPPSHRPLQKKSRGADPSIASDDYDPYLDPGPKLPRDLAADDATRAKIDALERRYCAAGGKGAAATTTTTVAPRPHRHLGDFWALYDHGPDAVLSWPADGDRPPNGDYPEVLRRARDAAERREARSARRAARDAAAASGVAVAVPAPTATATTTSSSPPIVYLFPGQGSQQAGKMLSAAAAERLPALREMLSTAQRVLGYDVLELVAAGEGDKNKLDDTRYAQPALFVAGMAALEALKAQQQQQEQQQQQQQQQEGAALPAPAALAGLSLGEYCALCAAGALSFEAALRVVKARGEAMAAAAASSSSGDGGRAHGMLSVVGLSDARLAALVAEAKAEAEAEVARRAAAGEEPSSTVLEVANLLFPEGRVVSGHVDALERLEKKAQAAGALKASRLLVAGAFHTRLMAPAAQALRAALDAADVKPLLPASEGAPLVISNVTGEPFPVGDAEAVKELLCRQLVEPVQWEATLRKVLALGEGGGEGGAAVAGAGAAPSVRLYELGPGQQLKAMVRRLSTPAWKAMANVVAL